MDIVRVTTSRGWPGSRVSADGTPARANSAYASSTTTMPGASASTASTVASGSAVPVGLFGLVRKTTSGACSRTCAAASCGLMPNSASRTPGRQRVPVPAVMISCIEYDGVKPSAVRPGPPNACSSCWMTSLDPLAAQTCAGASPWPRYAARSARSASASRSG